MSSADARDTAYLELRQDGWFGAAGSQLVLGVVAAVSGARGPAASYPTLDERWEWINDDLMEASHEFIAHLADSGGLADVVLRATDGRSLEAALRVRCKSWFQDRAKGTTVGAFDRKLSAALQNGERDGLVARVEAAEGRAWRQPEDPDTIFYGAEELLVQAAFGVEVTRLAYKDSARRDPLTDWRGLLEVMRAALGVALMAVLQSALRRVGIRRFGIDTRDVASLDARSDAHAFDDETVPDPLSQVIDLEEDPTDAWLVETAAAEVLAGLDPIEMSILGVRMEEGIEGVMELLGVGRSAAYERVNAAGARLRELVGTDIPDEFARAVASRALSIASLRTRRTAGLASSSSNSGGAA